MARFTDHMTKTLPRLDLQELCFNTSLYKGFSDTIKMKSNGIVFGYTRVSTTMQADDGVSLDVQRRRIEDYCKYKGLELTKVYEDAGISGKDMKRPAFQQMLQDATKGTSICVAELTRFSRSMKDSINTFAMLEEKGVNFICLNPELDFSTPYGRAFVGFALIMSQLERELISDRISVTMQSLSKQGKLRSRPPFGWVSVGKDKDFESEPNQQRIIQKIKTLYASGLKFLQIAHQLNDEGEAQYHEGMNFHGETIRRILIDHGVHTPRSSVPRPSLEQRIISHHKQETTTTSLAGV